MFYEVIPTEIFRAGGGILTYSSDLNLKPGHVVLIPLGKKTVTGLVYRQVAPVSFKTKPIIGLLHPLPLPNHLLKAAFWLSEYYLTPLPATANLLIPTGLTLKSVAKSSKSGNVQPNGFPEEIRNYGEDERGDPITTGVANALLKKAIRLNNAQLASLNTLTSINAPTKLLHGITGSGKTNIYLQLAADTLANGKSVTLLVPEIALTSQLVSIFQQTFGDNVFLIHSNQTPKERRETWLKIHTSPAPLILIGPRSALLAPVHHLGLIAIDEAHEGAYYQDQTPRYSALRLASFIAKTKKITCLLGSATPNITDYYLAKTKKSLVTLSEKAKTTAIKPEISIIDLKNRTFFTKNRYFSDQLLKSLRTNLQNSHQTLIFHNRRGSAPLTLCEHCGWQALCPNCYLPMTLHADTYELSCHICGYTESVPAGCPNCQKPGIIHKGFGTKLLESELQRLFKDQNLKIARFDGDNKKHEDLTSLYDEVKNGDIQILIGTQTLARGLDLPHLATVGIVQADAGLSLPDFTSEERTYELLTQVIGRVGRGHLQKAEVIVQTYQPLHPVIQTALREDFAGFADYLIKSRKKQALPPFTYLARLSVTYKTEKTTLAKIQQAYKTLQKIPKLTLSPPLPAFHERTARGFTWQLIIKSTSRQALVTALAPFSGLAGVSLVLDPPSLL